MRTPHVLALVVSLVIAEPGDAGIRRYCLALCQPVIGQCIVDGGTLRRCKKHWLRRCRKERPGVCVETTTTSTSTSTTRPRITTTAGETTTTSSSTITTTTASTST